ncbi:MAG: carbohydrate kinase family protein [Candidatus Woesearchaeota archaeon]|nr:carbohydrate kinase family protein [Candidatus Woesearchaeota archaeon]
MYDIITIRSATVDAFVKTSMEELIDIKTPTSEQELTCYPLGAKILIKELQFMTGGGGTNAAVSFARLGLKTAYAGNLGKDESADRILSELKKEHIDFIGTMDKKAKTNFSVVLNSIGHDRSILVYRDSSENLDFGKLNKPKMKAKWFYFSSMTGNSFEAGLKLMDYGAKNRIKIAYNPSEYQVKDGARKLKPLLEKTDVIIFNREEAAMLTGMNTEDRIENLLAAVRKLGPKIAAITDGPKGAYCSEGITLYAIIPRKVKVVETTGAGDAFASSFVAGLAKGYGIEFCMRLALANSESVIQYYGAKNILLKWNEAMKEMKKGPKVKKIKLK